MNSKEKNAQKGDFKSRFRERCYLNKALNPEVFEWHHNPLISVVLGDFNGPIFHFGIESKTKLLKSLEQILNSSLQPKHLINSSALSKRLD